MVIAGDAAEGDLLTNVSEELRETDIKQSPGTGKQYFVFLCVTKYIRCYKMLLCTELCHPKIHMSKL